MLHRRIRVLVIDDSAVVRKLVTEALAADPEIEVVGTAIDPYLARDKIVQLKPDVLTLDIEMPRMDGITFLKIIMQERPLPVIIMSSLTKTGSSHAIEALRLGAVDVLGKPGGSYSFGDLGPQLITKIKAAAVAKIRRPAPTRPPFQKGIDPAPLIGRARTNFSNESNTPLSTPRVSLPPRPTLAPANSGSTPGVSRPPFRPSISASVPYDPMRRLIVLGASTGGTEALREVLQLLPDNLPPIAIVQHIPAHFSRAFAERLNGVCAFDVREAMDGDLLVPGLALVAPGNFHMMLQWTGQTYRVRVADGPMVWHQRPAVDVMFKSAVDIAGQNAIGGILTGMGKDGAEGLLRLREKGAVTFAQDEETSVVYGMPKVAWEMGGAQRQLPLDQIADFIVHAASNPPPSAKASLISNAGV
ncbi:MAG TPA: chemotaxis response regulator protein-glutamate methylesterase [Opitutaceae bacterium]|nr:chemotaxis response regulator protein-glutamate methylesterase [Opitutaceae bacterium]